MEERAGPAGEGEERASGLRRLARAAVDLRPGEGRPVALLLCGSLLLGAFSVFLGSAAAAVFLDIIGADALPYLYLGTALLVASAGVVYARLEARVRVTRLLPGTLLVLLAATVAIRLALTLLEQRWPAVLLAGFGEMAASFVPLTFWALAGRLFDVRQAKRLLGPIGAGEVAATSVGGFTAPLLIHAVGTPNLLWVCTAALGAMVLIFGAIIRSFPERFSAGEASAEEKRFKLSPRGRPRLRDRYVVYMLGFAVVATVTYYFVQTAFLVQARIEFPTQDTLAGFLGVFTGVLSLVSFVGRSAVAGRAMNRFGIRVSLLVSPVAVALTALLAVAVGWLPAVVPAAAVFVFVANSVNRVCMEATWDSVYKPAYLVLYQPLPGRSRLWLQTVVESVAAPLAQGLAGLLLIAYRLVLGYDPVGLNAASLLFAGLWTVLGALVGRRYLVELVAAVAKRAQGQTEASPDAAALQMLADRLRSDEPAEVVFCLSVLDDRNHPKLPTVLLGLLDHPSPTVRKDVLQRIERRRAFNTVERVAQLLHEEEDAAVGAAALLAAVALDAGRFTPLLTVAAQSGDEAVRHAALVGLLRYTRDPGVVDQIRDLASSKHHADRALAARCIGDAVALDQTALLARLIDDRALSVRRAALEAAGKLDQMVLWPRVIQNLMVPGASHAASTALASGGAAIVPYLVAAVESEDTPHALRQAIARVCGRIKHTDAVDLLLDTLEESDATLRLEVLRALDASDHRAEGDLAQRIPHLVLREVEAGAWLSAAAQDVAPLDLPQHVTNTFQSELEFARERALLLLSLVYDSAAITRCANLLLGGDEERRAYALEILDNLLPHEVKLTLFPLLEDSSHQRRLEALRRHFPQERLAPDERVQALCARAAGWFHPWTAACWAHVAGLHRLERCHDALARAASDSTPVVAETAAWALAQLEDYPVQNGSGGTHDYAQETVPDDDAGEGALAAQGAHLRQYA